MLFIESETFHETNHAADLDRADARHGPRFRRYHPLQPQRNHSSAMVSRGGWRDVDDFINTSPPQGAPIYSIKEYKQRLDAGEPMEKKTPLQVAAEIRAYANTALGTPIQPGDNEELRLISNDIRALGYLGFYFAEKIEGAVYHHLGQKMKAIAHMQQAYWHWSSYTEIGDAMYKDQRLARTGVFRWRDYDDDALNDIQAVGGSGPGEKEKTNRRTSNKD